MKKLHSAILLLLFFSASSFSQNLLTSTFETWTDGNWANSSKLLYTYDSSGYQTNLLGQTWDISTNSWITSFQYNYTNNSNGTIQQYIYQNWNVSSNSWVNVQRSTYTYNSSSKVMTSIFETWSGGSWSNSSKFLYTYDANGYQTNLLGQIWNIPTNSWITSFQYNYTNNSNGTVQQYIYQNWVESSNNWVNVQRGTYIYTGQLGMETYDFNKIIVYPNPAKDIVSIDVNDFNGEINQVRLINIQGQNVFTYDNANQSKMFNLPINNFSEGIYLLQFQTSTGISTKKLIITK